MHTLDLFAFDEEPAAPTIAEPAPVEAADGNCAEPCMLVERSIDLPLRENPDYSTRMEGPDHGLINAWEAGRMKAKEDPQAADRARAGELLILPWKGGVEKGSKTMKLGTLLYLAMWQGLRGEDLHIDTRVEPVLTCAVTGTRVQYTGDIAKILSAGGGAA